MKRFFSGSVVAVAAIAGLAIFVAPGCGTEEPVDLGQVGRGPVIAKGSAALTQSQVCATGDTLCAATGAHAKHGGFACTACHKVGGMFQFDSTGPAVAAGKPLPAFDAVAKTCSNVACHGMYSGTYYYYFPGGDGEPELKSVEYAGSGGSTPSWYATGINCSACHGNPPRNGNWHSGNHAGTPTSPSNQCQFCHPDASSPNNGIGDTITNAALHANGAVNVQARFTSQCFGCH